MSKLAENGMVETILAHAQDKDEDRSFWPVWLRKVYGEKIKIFFVSVRYSYSAKKIHIVKTFGTRAFTEYDAKQFVLFFCKQESVRSSKKLVNWTVTEINEIEESDIPRFFKKNDVKMLAVSEKEYHALLCLIKMEDKEDLLCSCQELKDILSH
ncbi:MAG: hypothetical protein HYT93_00440 [Parcubacteria group bacterium]|nr:hypothetical protein [Parcubacteria group bacterium]